MKPSINIMALEPCPFCGSSDIEADGWSNSEGVTGPACNTCGASAGSISKSIHDNIDAWNRRCQWRPGIEAAPVACTLLATYFDEDVGEWIVQIFVSDKPTAPFTHWQFIGSPTGPWSVTHPEPRRVSDNVRPVAWRWRESPALGWHFYLRDGDDDTGPMPQVGRIIQPLYTALSGGKP